MRFNCESLQIQTLSYTPYPKEKRKKKKRKEEKSKKQEERWREMKQKWIHIYLQTHKLLLNSTLWCLTAISWASSRASRTATAPFLCTNCSWWIASSIFIPRTKQATYHILLGLYFMFCFTWHTYWKGWRVVDFYSQGVYLYLLIMCLHF